MGDGISVVDYWASPFGMRVRLALVEKGLEYEIIEEDLKLERSPLAREMNPVHRKIPILIHGGRAVCESANIVEYIDEAWKDGYPSLMPQEPYERARTRFWVDYIEKKVNPSISGIWRTKDGAVVEASKEAFLETFRTLEGALGDKPFLAGETFGFADLILIPFASFFWTCEIIAGFSVEKELPQIVKWVERCKQRASVSKVLPDSEKIYQIVCEFRRLFGIE